MNPLRIGFVGLGAVVRRRHIPVLAALEDVEFAAVANLHPKSTRDAATEFGIPVTFDHWRDLVEWDGVDVVWCGTYPNLHRAVTEAALGAGKHLFSQARMAANYEDAIAMYQLAEGSPSTTCICPYSGYDSGGQTMKDLLDRGAIGEPRHVLILSFDDRDVDPNDPITWRQRSETFGRNILDLGQLVEVQQRWLGGARDVLAVARTFVAARLDPELGINVPVERPDTLTAVANLTSGAVVTYALSRVAHHASAQDSIQIYGSEGTIRYESTSDEIFIGRVGSQSMERVSFVPASETVEQRFVRAIRSGMRAAGPVTFLEGLRYMEMVEAVARSVESGSTVRMPLSETPELP